MKFKIPTWAFHIVAGLFILTGWLGSKTLMEEATTVIHQVYYAIESLWYILMAILIEIIALIYRKN